MNLRDTVEKSLRRLAFMKLSGDFFFLGEVVSELSDALKTTDAEQRVRDIVREELAAWSLKLADLNEAIRKEKTP